MKATSSSKAAFQWFMIICCILTLPHTGCSTLTTAQKSPGKKNATWSLFKKKEYQNPQSINVTWTYDIFTKEGKPPTRGFGGRLYFYNEKSQAIPVEGELTVYGFDDTLRSHDGSSIESADKKFRFTPEQFTTHFSESELGASYSIWIPWDAAPGMQKKIMLIPTFKTKDGPVIRGNAATVLLPGEAPVGSQQPVLRASVQGGVQRATYTTASSPLMQPPTSHPPTYRTTTIQLPSRGYPSRPVLSPEQREAVLQQIQSAQPEVAPLQNLEPRAEDQAVNSMTTTTHPASQVAESMPGFHLAIGNQPGALQNTPLVNGSSLPGFAQASVGIRPAHSEPNPPQARAGSTAPSSAYPPH